MTVEEQPPAADAQNVIQLRFVDHDGDLSELEAENVAESIQGIVELTKNLANRGAFGDGPPPTVMLRPAEKGSFLIEALLQWAQDDPNGTFTIAASAGAVAVVDTVKAGLKSLRGARAEDVERVGDDTVKVKWSDGDVQEIPKAAWDELNKSPKRTKRALKKIMKPMQDGADELQLRAGSEDQSAEEIAEEDPDVVADRRDLAVASYEPDDTQKIVETITTEATVEALNFSSGDRWTLSTPLDTRTAAIEDEDFLRRVDSGLAIGKETIFEATIRQTTTIKNGRKTKEWVVTTLRMLREPEPNEGG